MSEGKKHNTIFDDVFRTMVQKMPRLLIPVINEVFQTDYLDNEEFQQLRNEHEEGQGKIITDSIIRIRDKTYHIECQSVDDNTMAIRMVEYDFAIALELATKNGRIYEMDFPESCVLYLRCTNATPDILQVKVNLPDKNSFMYYAKVVKLQNYTKKDIFEKKLLFFLPYYIMKYEKRISEISKNPEELQAVLNEYMEIRVQLEKALYENEKSVLYADLVSLMIKIADYILESEESLKKGVSDVMGGKILELESEKLLRIGKEEGHKEGLREGRKEGRKEGAFEMLASLVKEGILTLEEAAKRVEMSPVEFKRQMKV